jgi:hypothetical protein
VIALEAIQFSIKLTSAAAYTHIESMVALTIQALYGLDN